MENARAGIAAEVRSEFPRDPRTAFRTRATAMGAAFPAPVCELSRRAVRADQTGRMTTFRAQYALHALGAALLVLFAAAWAARADEPPPSSRVQQLQDEARALAPLVKTALARDFLAAVPKLPRIGPRTIYRDSARTHAWTAREAAGLPDSTRARLVPRTLDEKFYYDTRYGSPLAYVRALEILGRHGVTSVRGRRVADFGCGMLGQLRLLAENGAATVGIDVDPLLPALYSEPGDQGAVGAGSVQLATGQWPATEGIVADVGREFDVFISKNTLKNGYLHPAEKVDPRMLVNLGVPDSAFVAALARSIKQGGVALIYNLCPAPAAAGKPYIPWADGRCPFPRAAWEAAGFKVVAFDTDDGPAARAMGHALGWDAGDGGMKLETELFASWSLFVRL